jgi:hypothetical protein
MFHLPRPQDIMQTPHHPPAQKPRALLLGVLLAAAALAGPVLPARAAPKRTVRAAATVPSTAVAAATAPLCGGGPARPPRFAPGESFKYRLDLLGADVGTFEIQIERPPAGAQKGAAVLLRSRAHTSAFVSTNVGRYEAFAESLVGKDLAPISYREQTDEGDTHRSQAVEFPPRGDQLGVRITLNGKPEDLSLAATPSARDMLSAWLAIRGTALSVGTPFCNEVYASKHMWRVTGSVAAKEQLETPLGSFQTARIDTVATRADDPEVVRQGHFWVTDDPRRLPVVAIAEVKGKTVRAQLIDVLGPNGPPRAPRKTHREEARTGSGSAPIGRR